MIKSESKEVEIIQCWGKPLYAYCKATDGTVFNIPGFECEHVTCPDDAKQRLSSGMHILDIQNVKWDSKKGLKTKGVLVITKSLTRAVFTGAVFTRALF